uniref:Uncharacterized protein n=1 Tax=Oryza brachyantha TaxID=4533 RepID=J3MU92_ORYBR
MSWSFFGLPNKATPLHILLYLNVTAFKFIVLWRVYLTLRCTFVLQAFFKVMFELCMNFLVACVCLLCNFV